MTPLASDLSEPLDEGAPLDGASARLFRVRKAVKTWINELIDLGGRNNLLHYRDLKVGTLSLDDADPDAMTALLKGRGARITRLFPDPELRKDVLRRARTIYGKAKENFEERGIATMYLAAGTATWTNVRTWVPAAPILLIPAELAPSGAALDDFELRTAGEPELNPTLVHILNVDYGCDVKPEALLDAVDGPIDEPWEVAAAIDVLAKQASRVPGFTSGARMVLGNFSYAKLPMVRDLETSEAQLVAHDLIAALAGDSDAREAVRELGPSADAVPSAEVPAADEFLVLDADSTQSYAINAVLGGQNLIVRGPPGTGKSQSIANLIGALVARGKRVLFVAEKRAAIDAVLKRLAQQGLADVVLDLHGRVTSRKAFAQELGRALYTSRVAPRVDRSADQRRLERRRAELDRYAGSLHEKRVPWDLSVYEVQAALLRLGRESAYHARLRGATLEQLHGEVAEQAAADIEAFVTLGGFSLRDSASPWSHAQVTTSTEAQRAFELLDEVRTSDLPRFVSAISDAAADLGIPEPTTLNESDRVLARWHEISALSSVLRPSAYDLDLDALAVALAPGLRGFVRRRVAFAFSASYREARKELGSHAIDPKRSDAALARDAGSAAEVRRQWREIAVGTPGFPGNLEAIAGQAHRLRESLAVLEGIIRRPLTRAPFHDLTRVLAHLAEDRGTLARLPELHRLTTALTAAGLAELITELESQPDPDRVARDAYEWIWLQSILDRVLLADASIGSVTGAALDAAVEEFQVEDRGHIETTADRIRRIIAERATTTRDEYPDQASAVQRQANLKRRHMPVRTLVQTAPEVLLGLKPCWAMSPLMVSQLLPPRKCFDVVIFDEASQVTPADAATSVLRGSQLVVAGDERQLPPTAFFASETAGEADDEPPDEDDPLAAALAGTKGFESILDALGGLLPVRMLQWHYRSRDERLIAFSNAYVYDKMLTTFPGLGGERCIDHVEVPWQPGSETNSPTPEVARVVELIVDHATARPTESLGVIAMGIRHASRIDEALRARLRDLPEFEEFFSEDREEPFFVKNLERVQGDERDAIILSVGYGKNERGQLQYRFGPLLMAGGERRLNVAVTRAKRRLTLVTSFGSADLDPDRLNAEGMKLLRSYVLYAESGGNDLGSRAAAIPQLNPFEADVRDTLTARGLRLTPQHGASGYRIDFAVHDPERPGRFVLAIECDGAAFHSAQTARDRDRLRQEQLERIGWRFHRIWSSEWFHNREAALEKVMEAYEAARGDGTSPRPSGTQPHRAPAHGRSPREAGLRRERGPDVTLGKSIDEYWPHELDELMRWIETDDLLRTEDEVIDEAMTKLGFKRRGARIVTALRAAVRRARASQPRIQG